jgi:hypothetical protein
MASVLSTDKRIVVIEALAEGSSILHFAYYNLVRRHNPLRCTAMAARIEKDFWIVGSLIEAVS